MLSSEDRLSIAIDRARTLFSNAPHLCYSDYVIPGCFTLTWRDIYELQKYAANKGGIDGKDTTADADRRHGEQPG